MLLPTQDVDVVVTLPAICSTLRQRYGRLGCGEAICSKICERPLARGVFVRVDTLVQISEYVQILHYSYI